MSTIWRIRDRSTFDELRRRGRRARSGPVGITWLAGPGPEPPRVGYAVGRSVGPAVARNRVRRRLRALMAQAAPGLPGGAYLVSASSQTARASYAELGAALGAALGSLRRTTSTASPVPPASRR